MKTAIVLSLPSFSTFRFDLLKHPERVRFVGIFSEQDIHNLSDVQRARFAQIHVVPNGVPNPPPMLIPMLDFEATRSVVKQVVSELEIADVSLHCYYEINMLTAARLRDELGIRGPGYEQILPFRDKCVMKERLIERGVRVPRFGRFEPEQLARDAQAYFARIVDHVGLPFILKPIDSAGADGVHEITSEADFAALSPELGRGYEYEEFIKGTMYSVNLVSRGRKTVFGGVTEYLVNSFDVQRGRVNADINLLDDDPRVARMVRFAESALDALGWPDGGSHLELFHTDRDELVFLEVGARFKGMAGLAAMQRHYGVAFVNLSFEIETGLESRPYDGEQVYCFDGVLPKKHGVVERLVEPELESKVEMTWKIKVGDKLEQSKSLVATAGTFLVSNHDFAALYRDFKRLASYEPIIYK
jgi:hypothetical protein